MQSKSPLIMETSFGKVHFHIWPFTDKLFMEEGAREVFREEGAIYREVFREEGAIGRCS